MKYLSNIEKTLNGEGSVSYNELTKTYTVEYDGENITFTDEFFETILTEHGILPEDIVIQAFEQVKSEISNNE
jgi:hypothetical protein